MAWTKKQIAKHTTALGKLAELKADAIARNDTTAAEAYASALRAASTAQADTVTRDQLAA